MIRLAAAGVLLLTGCDTQLGYDEKYRADEDRHARLNPPGRYEMRPAPNDRVYVLDTGDGSIRICGPLGEPSEQQEMGCGPAATQ